MHEIITPTEMYQADALAVEAGGSSLRLMERAGRAVAKVIMQRFKKCRVAVICGPGNNGGDGFVAARLLAAKKWPVNLFITSEASALRGDAAKMFDKWRGRTHPFAALGTSFELHSKPQLIVDAIFGAGLNREMPKIWVDAIAAAGVPVVAVDVPSGLDGATGRPIGACVKADITVTFFRKKPGHLLLPGRGLCGEVVVADIGIPPWVLDEVKPQLWENVAPVLPSIASDTHKYRRGHAVVLSGPEFATGAARLAAMAAARIGSGVVSIVGTAAALRVHAAHVSSIMLKEADSEADLKAVLEDKRITALCLGPGAGAGAVLRRKVLAALRTEIACVLDADALTSFEGHSHELFHAIKTDLQRSVVLTPHEGEFARLFNEIAESHESKVERVRHAASLSGAIVLLKGADTVVGAPDGQAKINASAPAKLATAGSGDVLAGIITGLLAQGTDGFDAACSGAWLHGEAGNKVMRRSLIAEDLVDQIGR